MIIVGQDRFDLSVFQRQGILELGFFIVYVYSYYWFAVPVPADAPFLTLCLWQDLQRWAARDPSLSSACLRKLDQHTWFVSPRHVPFALFSNMVEVKTKEAIVKALHENPPSPVPMGKPERPRIYEDSTLESFVTSESWLFFKVSVFHDFATTCRLRKQK